MNPPLQLPHCHGQLLLTGLMGLLLFVGSSNAAAQSRIAVTEIKPLLVQAARQGQAHGVLTGVGAEVMARRFGAHTPIEIDVQRLHALPAPGCARLEVTTRQRAVREHSVPQDQTLVYQISHCADGRFPPQQ